jgi:hypothetical protein
MKTKSFILSVTLVSALCVQLNAQTIEQPAEESPEKPAVKLAKTMQAESKSTIEFDKYKHDFGTIKESDGKVSIVFTFTNLSDAPLVITKVEASCGCTKPEWTQEPVMPGEKGYIKAIYDPANRIYFFNKSLTVHSNGNPSKVVLSIQGTTVKQ